MFARAFIFSAIVHVSLIVGLVYVSDDVDISFDVNRGISSIAVVEKKRPEPEKVFHRIRPERKELKVIISPVGLFEYAAAEKKEKNPLQRAADTKKILGALSEKARVNSKNNPPEYPYIARRMSYQGRVTLSIEVRSDGRAGDVTIVKSSGSPVLDRSAAAAAGSWIFFEPGEMHLEKPIFIRQDIVFSLEKK